MSAGPSTRRRTRSNGEGAVYEDKSRKRWVGTVTVGFEGDRQIRKSVTGKTKAAVLERMKELQNAVDAGQDPAPRDLTVARFLDRWQTDVLPLSVAPSTLQQYRDVVRLYIVPHVGQKRLRTLQASDVSKMLQKLHAEGKSPNTCRLARSVLRRALRQAEREGKVQRNVAALADGVKLGQSESRMLTAEQARTLLASVVDHRLEAAFTVALSLGLRRGELLALSWDDVDLDATPPTLTVDKNVVRVSGQGLVRSDTKTAGSRRTVQLPAPVVASLRRHRTRQLEERMHVGEGWPSDPLGADLIFRTPIGTALDPNNFRQMVYKATREVFTPEAERPKKPGDKWPKAYQWAPHELRHSAASLLIAQDVPMKLISELLGHSSIRMTADVYGHLFDEAGAVAANAMTAALWGDS